MLALFTLINNRYCSSNLSIYLHISISYCGTRKEEGGAYSQHILYK